MRAYMFGAGASHSYNQSPTRITPPLARGLFDAYHELSIADDPHVLVGNIVNYVRDTRGISTLKFGNWNEDIEAFLSEVETRMCSFNPTTSEEIGQFYQIIRAYDESIFLFSSVLNEIQNGPISTNYSALLASVEERDVLITFNWDTLLDRALFATGYWFPEDGYALTFEGFYRDGWQTPDQLLSPSSNILYKLHGSTNWLMPYRSLEFVHRKRTYANDSVDDMDQQLFCYQHSADVFKTYKNRGRNGYQPFSYYYYPPSLPIPGKIRVDQGYKIISMSFGDKAGDVTISDGEEHANQAMPMIVAPVKHKEYSLCGNVLESVWNGSKSAIASCESLCIIGYSFPETDVRAWDLLKSAIDTRSSSLAIELVDPWPEQLVKRLEDRLGDSCNVSVHKCTFDEYLGS